MYCSSLGKKLQPAKKAWKGFTSTLQRKLQKLKSSKAVNKTSNRINTTLTALRRKRNILTRQRSDLRDQKRFASVYVDNLFMNLQPPAAQEKVINATMTVEQLSTLEMKVADDQSALPRTNKVVVDEWKTSVSRLTQLQGVDERAEEFIAKFREEMKLQRERSIGEYQEMLARGA